jgi:hypothetical protein
MESSKADKLVSRLEKTIAIRNDKFYRIPTALTKTISKFELDRNSFDGEYVIALIDFLESFTVFNEDKIKKLQFIMRATTAPLNFPFFRHLVKRFKSKSSTPLIEQDGVHYIYALPGGGKTSLSFDLIEDYRYKSGRGAYVNTAMERPRYDDLEDIFYKYHYEFNVEDFFGSKPYTDAEGNVKYKIQQLKKFNRRFPIIVFDELLSWLNHRVNNTKDYLQIFIALIQFLAQRRHRGIKRVYFLNQLDTTDIQLMSAFNYVHEVQIDLDIPYIEWIKTGRLELHIMGWWIYTYSYYSKGKKTADNKYLVQKHYRKRTADFDYFETLSQKEDYDKLPEDKITGIYRGKE